MKHIAVVYDSWFMDRNEEWDFTSHLMVVGGEEKTVELMPWNGGASDTARFRKKYPEAEFLDIEISMLRGNMEKCAELKNKWPEHWKLIGESWAEWEDA